MKVKDFEDLVGNGIMSGLGVGFADFVGWVTRQFHFVYQYYWISQLGEIRLF